MDRKPITLTKFETEKIEAELPHAKIERVYSQGQHSLAVKHQRRLGGGGLESVWTGRQLYVVIRREWNGFQVRNEIVAGQPIRCYDSGETSGPDRYTVVFMDRKLFVANPGMYAMVGMSGAPFHPQGIGQHCEGKLGKHLGKRIPFASLPEDCRTLVLRDLQ